MTTLEAEITIHAYPAPMGWCVYAERNNRRYIIATGLRSPDSKVRYWQSKKRLAELRELIDRADAPNPTRQNER